MKKTLTIAIAIAAALTFTGCTPSEPAPVDETPISTPAPAPVETTEPSTPEAEEVVVIDVVDGEAVLPNGQTITCEEGSASVVVKEDGSAACTTAEKVDW